MMITFLGGFKVVQFVLVLSLDVFAHFPVNLRLK